MVRKKNVVVDGSAQDFHKAREAREAKVNRERNEQTKSISQMIHRPDMLRAEISRIKTDLDATEQDKASLKSLTAALAVAEREDAERIRHLEMQSQIAKRRKLAAGRHIGPPVPEGAPPRYGRGLPPPPPPPMMPVVFNRPPPPKAVFVPGPMPHVPEARPCAPNPTANSTAHSAPNLSPQGVAATRPASVAMFRPTQVVVQKGRM
jgi:hypothetical protein